MSDELEFLKLEYYKKLKERQQQDGSHATEIPLENYVLPNDVEEQVLNGKIPTASFLQQLQNEKGEVPRDANDNSPEPFASKTRQTDLVRKHDFTDIDKHASNILPTQNENAAQFANRLYELCNQNIHYVRSAYCFVGKADVDTMTENEGEEPTSDFYKLVKNIRSDKNHSEVFHVLMKQSTVPFRQISGQKKAVGYEEGKKVTGNGNWYAVYVDGEWRFVDPFWGSVWIEGYDKSNYQEILQDGTIQKATNSEGKHCFGMREEYFLTDPVHFFQSHWPIRESSDWLLMVKSENDNPLPSQSHFEMMVSYNPDFDARPISHPWNVIPGRPGQVFLLFRTRQRAEFQHRRDFIHDSYVNEEIKQKIKSFYVNGKHFSKPVIVGKDRVKYIFRPPVSAKYKLKIAKMFTYVVHCPKEMENPLIPIGHPDLPYFGADSGIESECEGEIKSLTGEAKISLKDSKLQRRKLRADILSCDDSKISSQRTLTWSGSTSDYSSDSGSDISSVSNNFTFLAPDPGLYAIVINEVYENYEAKPLCQFMIEAMTELEDNHWKLPNFDELGGLGFNTEYKAKVIPDYYKDPYITWRSSNDLEINFKLSEPLELNADLLFVEQDGRLSDFKGFSLVSCGQNQAQILVRFRLAGNYILRVQVRQAGSSDWKSCINYFIRALYNYEGSAYKLPTAGNAWASTSSNFMTVKEPRNNILFVRNKATKLNQISFHLESKGNQFKRIYAAVEDTTEGDFEKSMNGIITGSISNIQKPGAKVILYGIDAQDKEHELLSYRFHDENLDKQAVEEGKRLAKEIEKQRQEQEKIRDKKSKLYKDDLEGKVTQTAKSAGVRFSQWDIDRLAFRNSVSSEVNLAVRAALQLLGCDENDTANWTLCKSLMQRFVDNQSHSIRQNSEARRVADNSLKLLKQIKNPQTLFPSTAREIYEWALSESRHIREITAPPSQE